MKIDDLHSTVYDCRYVVHVSTKYRKPHLDGKLQLLETALMTVAEDGMEIERCVVRKDYLEVHCSVAPGFSVTKQVKSLLRQAAKAIGMESTVFARSLLVLTHGADDSHLKLMDYLNAMKRYHGDNKGALS